MFLGATAVKYVLYCLLETFLVPQSKKLKIVFQVITLCKKQLLSEDEFALV